MLANPLMDTIVGQEGDAAFVSLASGYFFPEPQQWIDPTQPWSDPTPALPLHATAQPLGPSVAAPTLGPFANAAGLARVRGSQYTQQTDFANQELSTHNVPVAYVLDSNDCQHLPFAEASRPLLKLPSKAAMHWRQPTTWSTKPTRGCILESYPS